MQGIFKFFISVLHGDGERRDGAIGGFLCAPKNRVFAVKNRVFTQFSGNIPRNSAHRPTSAALPPVFQGKNCVFRLIWAFYIKK